jgi:peptide chain release factor 2
MEVYEIKQSLALSQDKLNQLKTSMKVEEKEKFINQNEILMAKSDFWNDIKNAQKIIKETNSMKRLITTFHQINDSLVSLAETVDELNKNYDEELLAMVEDEYLETIKTFDDFEVVVLLSHDYDQSNAIIELHPGAGGTESQDWASMLYRMYIRWAERRNYKVTILDYQDGDEAGLKSCSILISGDMAYGYLKAEKGVHRLVRISPFDSSGRRHTSFASVDVMPEFTDSIEIIIDDKDLTVETMRASGAGGQHINKTDSAVRIIHNPTNIVVSCQTQRSQLQNKDQCMIMLKSKLYQKKIEEQEAKVKSIKGEQLSNEWGSQIRSYVFTPYTMVKDHRTSYEVVSVKDVMDGDIDDFIFNYLKSQII